MDTWFYGDCRFDTNDTPDVYRLEDVELQSGWYEVQGRQAWWDDDAGWACGGRIKNPNAQRSKSKWNQRHFVEYLALQAAVLSTNDGIEVRLLVQCHPKACSRRTGRSLTYQDIRAGKLPSPNADVISTKRHHWCSRFSMSWCRTQTRVERRKCSLVVDHCRLRIVLTAHNVGWVF